MIDEVTAGAKVKLREKISDSVPVGSIATVLYIDDLDNVFIEWVSNGRLTSFSKKNFRPRFPKRISRACLIWQDNDSFKSHKNKLPGTAHMNSSGEHYYGIIT